MFTFSRKQEIEIKMKQLLKISTRDWTQEFGYIKQALYHWAIPLVPKVRFKKIYYVGKI
jgi:hypothetical protein